MDKEELFTLYQEAKKLYENKQYTDAIPLLVTLKHHSEYRLKANTNIGGCLLQLGHIKAGLKFISQALEQDDQYVPALINKAEAHLALSDPKIAIEIYTRLTQRCPKNWPLFYGLAKALHASNHEQDALDALSEYLTYSPSDTSAIILYGEIQSNLNDHVSAIKTFGKALDLEPKNQKIYSNLGVVMMRRNNFTLALRYFEIALKILPDCLADLRRIALVHYTLSETNAARDYFCKAFALDPTSTSLFLSRFLLLPSIPLSANEIEQARKRFVHGLNLAEKSASTLVLDTQNESIPHLFYLAYHDKDDKLIIERYIRLARRLANAFLPANRTSNIQPKEQNPRRSQRIKIGFLSSYFSTHSNCFAFEGLIRNLNRELFEIYLIHTSLSQKDGTRDRLDSLCEHSIQLSNNLQEISDCLCSLDLDMLYFTDLGMNAYDYLIPFLRSARIQITGWGIPHTSGIEEIDYYISCEGLEPPDASRLYTEELVMMPGGVPCCFLDDTLTLYKLPREYFILPPEGLLVGCLQSLHKLHPDFDFILEEIAKMNPELGFVFVEDRIPERTKRFIDRLERNAPLVRERMVTHALMNRAEYHSLCNCIDLLLDPIYYGSGITFFEASFVGTPIVTIEGKFLRSRVVASCYREMQLTDPPIADNWSEYIELATDLLQNSARRQELKADILRKKHLVFNRVDYVRNFESFCIQALHQ
ncbi:glycosyltransferase family 41 protein [Cyanobium sp. Copco_Reservoir_LC18]|uniref:tetratricopeptide repeat protein n=1 Tax=Cyanobium sp. Copco_Reservoir_LC18 TaxID=1328305 RepID=UPI00135AC3EC|nr:glycosyltransferase family 41 protein [Cyanobium sp. Copco_Reservoir_LC18]